MFLDDFYLGRFEIRLIAKKIFLENWSVKTKSIAIKHLDVDHTRKLHTRQFSSDIWKALLQWKIVPVKLYSVIKPKLLILKKGAIRKFWTDMKGNWFFKVYTRILFLAHIAEQTRQPTQVATIIYYLLLSWFRLETQISMHPNS